MRTLNYSGFFIQRSEYSTSAIKTAIVLPLSLAGFIQRKDRNGTWEIIEDPLIFSSV